MEWLREVGAFMVFLSSALFLQKRTWATHQLDGFVTVSKSTTRLQPEDACGVAVKECRLLIARQLKARQSGKALRGRQHRPIRPEHDARCADALIQSTKSGGSLCKT